MPCPEVEECEPLAMIDADKVACKQRLYGEDASALVRILARPHLDTPCGGPKWPMRSERVRRCRQRADRLGERPHIGLSGAKWCAALADFPILLCQAGRHEVVHDRLGTLGVNEDGKHVHQVLSVGIVIAAAHEMPHAHADQYLVRPAFDSNHDRTHARLGHAEQHALPLRQGWNDGHLQGYVARASKERREVRGYSCKTGLAPCGSRSQPGSTLAVPAQLRNK